jgi:hypothetical protein
MSGPDLTLRGRRVEASQFLKGQSVIFLKVVAVLCLALRHVTDDVSFTNFYVPFKALTFCLR